MAEVKNVALAKAENGDLESWKSLAALPPPERGVLNAIREVNPELAIEILTLLAGAGTGRDGKKPMPFRGAVYAAGRQLKTGERLGREFYWSEVTGPIDSIVGIRDLVTRNIGPTTIEGPFPLNEDEANVYGLDLTGDKADRAGKVFITIDRDRRAALESYTAELVAYKGALEAVKMRADLLGESVKSEDVPALPVLRYVPVVGIGIVYAEEMYAGVYKNPDDKRAGKKPKEQWGGLLQIDFKNFSWNERLLTRAARNGYKKVPGALRGAVEVADDAEVFDLGGKPVGREQFVAAVEQEKARAEAYDALALRDLKGRDKKLAEMQRGAYGPPPTEKPEPAGVPTETEEPETDLLPAIDVAAVIERIRADAKTRDGDEAHKPSAAQLASAWDKLRLLDWNEVNLGALVHAIFDADEFATRGQAAAVFYWLRQEGDKTVVNPDARAEATAIIDAYLKPAESSEPASEVLDAYDGFEPQEE